MDTGASASIEFTVTDDDTSVALGSGDVPFLATPRLLAWLEAATCEAVRMVLDPGDTTVGIRVSLHHRAPSAVGANVRVTASLVAVNGYYLDFEVVATDPSTGSTLADGEIVRAIVDPHTFGGN